MSHSYLMRPLELVSQYSEDASKYFLVGFHVGYELGRLRLWV